MVKQLEKDIQMAVCQYLEFKHYFFWRQNTTPVYNKDLGRFKAMPKYSMNGIPDIILIKDGQFIGLEIKQPKGIQSDNQKKFEELCIKNGGQYHLITSVDQLQSIGL